MDPITALISNWPVTVIVILLIVLYTLYSKLIKARNFQSAMQMVRQLEFGLFDFKLHSGLYQADEVQKLLDEIRKEISPLLPPKYNKFQNSFTHIFAGGYAAGYYSYKWRKF